MQAYTCNPVFLCLAQLGSVHVAGPANTAFLQYLKIFVDNFEIFDSWLSYDFWKMWNVDENGFDVTCFEFVIVPNIPKYVKNARVTLGRVYIAVTLSGRTKLCEMF